MIRKKLNEILKKEFGLARVEDDMSLMFDLALDYVECLELIMCLEKALGVRLPDDVANVVTVGDLIRKVEDYMPVRTPENNAPAPLNPVAGLYAIRNGAPVCCVTEKKCNKLPLDQVNNNTDLQNLCMKRKCIIAHNFARLATKKK